MTSGKLVAFDASVLIIAFSLKKDGTPDVRRERALHLIDTLGKAKDRLLVPSVSLAEATPQMPIAKRADFQSWLGGVVHVASFDGRAAKIAADIFGQQNWKSYIDGPDYPRQVVKADVLIVATCVAANVSVIYSVDPHFVALAKGLKAGLLNIEPIPQLPPVQLTLPVKASTP